MPPTEAHGGSTRSSPKVLLVVAAALLVARVTLGIVDVVNPESRAEQVEWTAPAAAADAARASGRLVLYVFTDSKVAASRKLSSEMFATPQVAQELGRRYVAVRIDGSPVRDTPETADLRARFGVGALPAMVLANPDGSKFKRIDGFESSMATMQALAEAQMEVMDIPFQRGGRSFRFQIGGHGRQPADSIGVGSIGAADSVARFR